MGGLTLRPSWCWGGSRLLEAPCSSLHHPNSVAPHPAFQLAPRGQQPTAHRDSRSPKPPKVLPGFQYILGKL